MSDYYHNIEEEISLGMVKTDRVLKHIPHQNNRIEQLAAACGELEAKLEKAVRSLEKVQGFVRDLEPYADPGHTLVPALREACETLKELKGFTNAN